MPTYLFGLILYVLPESLITFPKESRWIVLTAIFFLTFIIPALATYSMVRAGLVKSMELHDRLQRRFPFLLTTFCYASTTYLMQKEDLFGNLFYLIMLLITLSVFATYVVSFFWKISAHSVGIGGALGILVFLHTLLPDNATLYLILGYILVSGAVMSARLALQAHTPAQVYAGFLTGFGIGASLLLFI